MNSENKDLYTRVPKSIKSSAGRLLSSVFVCCKNVAVSRKNRFLFLRIDSGYNCEMGSSTRLKNQRRHRLGLRSAESFHEDMLINIENDR